MTEGTKGTLVTNNWSVEYDGRLILELLRNKPKCSLEHVMMVIKGEGGYVDSKGIIHKGKANNKVVEID